jgi:hypothetical protein
MTAAGAAAVVATHYKVRAWIHDSPASGANTVDVAVSGPDVIAWAVSATSAGTPTDYTTGNGTNDPSITVLNAASGDIIADLALTIASPTVGADQTQRVNLGATANAGFFAGGSTQPGANGGAMTWTQGTADNWAQAGIRFPDAGGGGGGTSRPVRTRLTLGLGA